MDSYQSTAPIRILILAGYSQSLINFRGSLIKTLCESGLDVHTAAPGLLDDSETETRKELEDWGVITHDIKMQRTGANPVGDFGTLFSLYHLCRKVKADILLSYTIKPVIYGALTAWLAGVPRRYALITGLGYAFGRNSNDKYTLVQRIGQRLYGLAMRRSTHVFFQNPDDQLLFKELGLLPSSIPSTLVNGSGIDTAHFYQSAVPDSSTSFLLTARLMEEKGVRFYAEAAQRLKVQYPRSTFYLVGNLDSNPGSIKQAELDEWICSGAVQYLGRLSDVRPAIINCHVFVLPTYYREGVPRTILEALSMGRPVITTDTPGCRETVVEGQNGFLIPIKSVDELVGAMARFIENPELASQMGKRSRQIAEEKYDVHKVNIVMLDVMGIR